MSGGGRARRRARLLRLWPAGIGGRVALVLVAALLAVQAATAAVFWFGHRERHIEAQAAAIGDRVVRIVGLVEDMPAAERAGVIWALNSPGLRLRFAASPQPLPPPERWRFAGAYEPVARRALAGLGDRPLETRFLAPGRRDAADGFPGLAAERGGRDRDGWRGPALAIRVGLRTGEWLLFRVGLRPPRGSGLLAAAFWLAPVLLAAIVLSAWAARRMTRPLRRLAEAADRLGLDARAPPLEERGGRETRAAARAFNRMAGRIRALVDDRTTMLAAISHDLRTVATRLALRAEFIEDPEQRGRAQADVEEMRAMLDATLSFARDDIAAEARVPVDLAALVRALVDDIADSGGAARYEGPDRLAMEARPAALRRAVANLLENALRYGGRADARLAAGAGAAIVEIADRGPGIPPGRREEVFRPFVRLEPSRGRETGGIGLGLAIARAAARRHGGDIELRDREGGGLVARLTLPLGAAGAAGGAPGEGGS